MKLLKSLYLAGLLIFGLLLGSCQKDLDYIVPDNVIIGQIINPSPVQASVQGKVLNENELPVVGATVRSGSQTTTTDSRGLFRFNNIQLDKYASVVTVEKNGYFLGLRTFSAKANSLEFVKIKLIPKVMIGSIDASAGGSVNLSNGSSISFQPNTVIVKSTGQAYTGTIQVYAAAIDPTSPDITQIIPGSFQAIDANGFRVTLQSFGMAAVQLEGSVGELLQIATGKKAKLKLSIPVSLQASAPASIPMWSLNETDGLWKEEGNGTKTGNFYEGDVSHFSFWNYDIGNNSIFLEFTLNNANGPLPHTLVKITRTSNGSFSFGYTDSTGHAGGLVFSNEPLLLEVLSNCYQAGYSQNIGPFSQNTNLGAINTNLAQSNFLTISGVALNCNQEPVSTGLAMIYFEGQQYNSSISNGNFGVTINRCSNSTSIIEVVVLDNNSQQQSITWTGTASSGNVHTDTLRACGIAANVEYIDYMVDGVNFHISSDQGDSIMTSRGIGTGGQLTHNFIYAKRFNTPNYLINLDWEGTTTGTFDLDFTSINQYFLTAVHASNVFTTVTITSFGQIGQFMEGTFSGTGLESGTSVAHSVSGSFRLRRN